MDINHIERHFESMGARFKLTHEAKFPRARLLDYAMDIDHDSRGSFFALRVPKVLESSLDVSVMQTLKHDRHLLLLVRKEDTQQNVKDRFLCGHDERHWFVAAVPGGASSVNQAKEALKPAQVRVAQSQAGLAQAKRNSRKNRAFRRQGEWFFVAEPALVVSAKLILHDEPLSRGNGSKPHIVAEVYRTGGEVVYVHGRYPAGVSADEQRRILNRGETRQNEWRMMTRNAGVYARGTVRHADHEVITLHNWHRVFMNTESQSRTMANLAFLD